MNDHPEIDRSQAACARLPLPVVDSIFFPGHGGKPGKAMKLCSGCPIKSECLIEAIELDLEGFFAGTTKNERRLIAKHHRMKTTPLTLQLPPEPQRKRRVYRKIIENNEDTVTYLESLESPLD